MTLTTDFKIFSIGDCAATIELGNCINEELNKKILSMHCWLTQNSFAGLTDLIIAHSSLSVYYDAAIIKTGYPGFTSALQFVEKKLQEAYIQSAAGFSEERKEVIEIPVCYDDEFACDLDYVSFE